MRKDGELASGNLQASQICLANSDLETKSLLSLLEDPKVLGLRIWPVGDLVLSPG